MTADPARRGGDAKTRAKLAALPGVRSVRRPVETGTAEHFDLYYVRTGPASSLPLVIIPGGPGMASIAGYRGLRRRAAALGLDVIMVEHRGVGMSRRDDSGGDLGPSALTITQVVDDVAAVLDHAGVDTAVVYGTSYGTYVAAGLGVRHPNRVRAMVLDSGLLNSNDFDVVRRECRRLLWQDDTPIAAKVRKLTEAGQLVPEDLTMAAAVYGIGGADLLDRHLDLLLDGRRALWTAMRRIALNVARRKVPYRNESDLVGPIGFRELNFVGVPDGLPLDTTLTWRDVPGAETPFAAEPFDLVAEMPGFRWPTAVLSGGRDMITPPAVAETIAGLIPDAALVRFPTAGHSILDTREAAALRIATDLRAGRADDLPVRGEELDRLPAPPALRLAGPAIQAIAVAEGLLPAALSRPLSRLLDGVTS